MKKIRIGHLGTYHDHSYGKLECILKYPDLFEVVGVVAESEERKQEIMEKGVYKDVKFVTEDEMFNELKPDAMLVEGYELDLLKLTEKCVERGIHVHVDKPAGNDVCHFEKILNITKEKNLVLQMAYMYRYNNAINECMRLYKEGKLGEITGIDAYMCTEHWPEKNKWLEAFDGGIMFFLGCHMIDLVYMFAGKPDKIHSIRQRTKLNGNNSEDNCVAVFEYDKFSALIRMNSTEVNGYGRRQFVLAGSKGTVEIKPLENPTIMTVSYTDLTHQKGASIYKDMKNEVELTPQKGRYDEMMLDFYDMIVNNKKNRFTPQYELELQKLVMETCTK